MRGRLIFPLFAEIRRLDTATMESSGHYDDDYREPTKTDTDDDGIGEENRDELASVTLKAQIEHDREEMQRITHSGNVPDSAIGLVVFIKDLEDNSLIPADGNFDQWVNARLVAITDRRGIAVNTFDRVPVYCYHVYRLQADIGRTSNLALMLFGDRPQGRS